jgi:hypothetical protein
MTQETSRSWEPIDFAVFSTDYLAGMTNMNLALKHKATADQIKHYLKRARDEDLLPDRSDISQVRTQVTVKAETDKLSTKVIRRVRTATTALSITDLANEFDVAPRKIQEIIDILRSESYLVKIEDEHVKFGQPNTGSKSFRHAEYLDGTRKFKFGIATDAHLCSRYSRLDHLNTFFDLCQQEGVTTVFDCGNQLDGEARFNMQDLIVHGMGNQVDYWVENWPQREGITTHFVCGDDHEGWYVQREGVDIGWYMQSRAEKAGRTDVKYLGYMEHDFEVGTPEGGKTIIRVQHPGGGTAYATSYQPQKIVESLSGGEKPHVLLLGHYHKAGNFFVRNVHTVLGGCFCDQTPFMRKKRLAAHVGGVIGEITQAPDGSVLRFQYMFVPFYADHQTSENWQYHMYDKGG